VKIETIKQAVQDIAVRKPDLDKENGKKLKDPDDGTQSAPESAETSDLIGTTPESCVTDKSAEAWAIGFVDACARRGADPEEIIKNAGADVNPLVAFLQNNPQLRQSIQRISMDQHPLLRHFTGMVGLPGISNIADRMLYKKVNSIGDGLQGMGGHGQRLLDSITRELGNYELPGSSRPHAGRMALPG
jgi:hypothetical protein